MTPRVFAPINTVIGIIVYFLLVWLNESSLEWSGNPVQGWTTALIFLAGGAITGGVTGKALDFYCERVERRLIQLEREREEKERQRRERIENEIFEKKKQEIEKLEREALERKMLEREIALAEEKKWYEEHGDDDYDYEDEDED
ncbi:hypothetical protein [Nostoc sp.]|uniref:hypothetical protein n=1 Tax=Nostoc sp. TaxID=1180 RepID=UPI002FF6B30B